MRRGYPEYRRRVRVTAARFDDLLQRKPGWQSGRLKGAKALHTTYGTEHEWKGREWIEGFLGCRVKQVGRFFQYDRDPAIGAQPDGIIDADPPSVLEIKCTNPDRTEGLRVKHVMQLWIGCLCSGIDMGTLLYWSPTRQRMWKIPFPREWWERVIEPDLLRCIEERTTANDSEEEEEPKSKEEEEEEEDKRAESGRIDGVAPVTPTCQVLRMIRCMIVKQIGIQAMEQRTMVRSPHFPLLTVHQREAQCPAKIRRYLDKRRRAHPYPKA